ncbi:uncharacterized protein LOC135498267 [Lineus longissimus]|uniref:uncharacterized protein LOC135498267 n=1 Tax=Lineus longissimus TaxID=88925 RepID=UPI00315D09A1
MEGVGDATKELPESLRCSNPSDNTTSPPEPKKAKKDEPDPRRKRTPSPWRFPIVDRAQDRRKSDAGGAWLGVPNGQTHELSPDSTSIECCPGTNADIVSTQSQPVNVTNCAVTLPSYSDTTTARRSTSLSLSSAAHAFSSGQSSESNGAKVPNNLGPLVKSPDYDSNAMIISPTSGHCSHISSSENVNNTLGIDTSLAVTITSPVEKGIGSTSSSPVDAPSSLFHQPNIAFPVATASPTEKSVGSSSSSPVDAQTHDPFQRRNGHKLERSDDVYLDTSSPPDLRLESETRAESLGKEEVAGHQELKKHAEQGVSSSTEVQKDDLVCKDAADLVHNADNPASAIEATDPSTSPFKVPISPCRIQKSSRVTVDPLTLRCSSPFSPLCSPKISPQSHGKYSLTEVMALLESRIPKLLDIIDFTTSKPLDDLKFVKRRTNYNPDNSWRIHIADKMEELGIVQLLIRIWNSIHKEDGTVHQDALTNIIQVVSTLWNTTDISRSLCEKITRSGAITLFLEDLRNDAFNSTELENDEMKLYYVKGIMGIMHNICRHYRDSRDVFRDAMAVKSLQGYLESDNPVLKLKVLILLSYIITEDENMIIHADDTNICYIIEILKSAIESEGHFSKKYGFCASELVHGLNHLVANDSNKERVVRNHILPLYVSLLSLDCKPEEQKFAARGIWILAFNAYCKKRIKEENGSLEGLQLLITSGTEEGVRHAARGALWEISARWKVSSISHDADVVASEAPHVMISYQWDSKPVMLKVKDRLKAEGYKVWMDVENMSGSTLEAMALAVEKAVVVILCVSQRYKDSPNCRSEAEYTYRLRRSIVPLILQKDYTPDGWLGMMVGTKLYFDFSDENNFDFAVDGLIRELGDRGRVIADGGIGVCDFVGRSTSQESYATCSNAGSPETKVESPTETAIALPERPHSLSKILEIKKWLENHGLSDYSDRFEDFDGELLYEMKRMQETAPDFLYRTLQSEYGFKLRDILLLNRALRKSTL